MLLTYRLAYLWHLELKMNMYTKLSFGALCGCTSSGTMLHCRAHPTAVRDHTTILSLRLISICVCLFLEPRLHAGRVYADAK